MWTARVLLQRSEMRDPTGRAAGFRAITRAPVSAHEKRRRRSMKNISRDGSRCIDGNNCLASTFTPLPAIHHSRMK